jgi:hypothetical protein
MYCTARPFEKCKTNFGLTIRESLTRYWYPVLISLDTMDSLKCFNRAGLGIYFNLNKVFTFKF